MRTKSRFTILLAGLLIFAAGRSAVAAEKLVGLYFSPAVSQSLPWIAQEAGLFPKYNLDFQLVYISSSPMATAAIVGGDVEVILTGGVRSEEHTSELQSRFGISY